jgi:pyruvate/2-oxoglutarate dehydrogenase complex dihydrolipoamide acyltransferase (E2) component
MALKKHPKINSQWKEEAITINHHVNIGVAVAVEDGLVTCIEIYRCNEFVSNRRKRKRFSRRAKTKTITYRNGRKYVYSF